MANKEYKHVVGEVRELRSVLTGLLPESLPPGEPAAYAKLPPTYTEQAKIIGGFFEDSLSDLIEAGIRRQAERGYTDGNAMLRDLGRTGLAQTVSKNEFVERVLRKVARERFMDKTLDQRVRRARRVLERSLISTTRRGIQEGLNQQQLRGMLYRRLSGKGYIDVGGSPMRWSTGLVLGETHRAYWEALKEVATESGVKWMKWVLNPAHPKYNYYEICERHAEEIDPGETGIPADEQPAPGVFRIDRFPDTPHPYCGCYPLIYG